MIIRLILYFALAIFSNQLWSTSPQLANCYQYDANVEVCCDKNYIYDEGDNLSSDRDQWMIVQKEKTQDGSFLEFKASFFAAKGLGKFDDATTLAAGRLGFDPTDVIVKNGIADIPIIFTSKVSPRDLTAVTNALKGQGVKSVQINTGPIINPSITSRLENAADTGKSIFGGFKARRTNNPENPFVLDKGL